MTNSDSFKQVMRQWAATVTIVTTKADGLSYGLTATSFTSLGINPPTVLVCVNRNARTHSLIEQSGIFCVNLLSSEMKSISDRFAGRMPDVERFAGLQTHVAATGAPVLNEALAYLDCKVIDKHIGGDHTIFIGEVLACEVQQTHTPLLYLNGKYRAVGDEV